MLRSAASGVAATRPLRVVAQHSLLSAARDRIGADFDSRRRRIARAQHAQRERCSGTPATAQAAALAAAGPTVSGAPDAPRAHAVDQQLEVPTEQAFTRLIEGV